MRDFSWRLLWETTVGDFKGKLWCGTAVGRCTSLTGFHWFIPVNNRIKTHGITFLCINTTSIEKANAEHAIMFKY